MPLCRVTQDQPHAPKGIRTCTGIRQNAALCALWASRYRLLQRNIPLGMDCGDASLRAYQASQPTANLIHILLVQFIGAIYQKAQARQL